MEFARYFLRFSYIGSNYRGSQRSNLKLNKKITIQGNFELALRPSSYQKNSMVLSSRTDSGVHALDATAHIDILPFYGKYPQPHSLKRYLNRYFIRDNAPISVHEIRRVPDTFSARYNTKLRTYLYRLAIIRKDAGFVNIPIEEWGRCLFLRDEKFDVNKMQDALKQFEGTHDFETFKKRLTNNPWKHSVRTINSIEVNPGRPLTIFQNDSDKYFDYWNIIIKSKAFVHNQVRRMVATGIAAGKNIIDSSDIKVMLTVPSYKSWNNRIEVASPYGLYLYKVDYDEEDFLFKDDEINEIVTYDMKVNNIRDLIRTEEVL